MAFVVPAPETVSAPVLGSANRFPVRRIYCVGRNYADHIREMGFDPAREPPFFFQKPTDAVIEDGAALPYPPETSDLHYEVELVVAIGQGGEDIPEDRALDHVYGYAVGIDMTRRDLQIAARDRGRPWETGKSFDRSAPLGPLVPATTAGHPARGRIRLAVNGETRQDGDLGQLIWSVPEVIAALSRLFRLEPGDLIYTGTPAGVGPVKVGDRMEATIDGLPSLTITVGSPR